MNVTGGATNVTTYFILRTAADGTATTGATITSIDLQYVRTGAAPAAKVDATALAATDSAHADNKAIEIDATDAPGLYRVDWPDAAFAAGVKQVILSVKLASSFTEHMAVDIDAPVNTTMWNGTLLSTTNPLPNAAADAAGGLPVSDAGGLDLDTKLANTNEITAARAQVLTDWINGGRLDLLLDAIPTTAMRGTDNANTTVPDAAGTAAGLHSTSDAIANAIKAITDNLPNSGALSDLATIINHLTDVKGAAFDGNTDALDELRDKIDTIVGGSAVNLAIGGQKVSIT